MKLNIEEKLETSVATLRDYAVIKRIFPLDVKITDSFDKSDFFDDDKCEWRTFSYPYLIYEHDTYYLFKTSFDIKKENENQIPYLCIETFIDGVASTIRPQGLLYLNGELVQGIDINHFEVPLEEGHYEMLLHFYSHTFAFSFPLYFSIKYKDKRTEKAYYDFLTVLDYLKVLLKDDQKYIDALPIVDNSLNLIDFREKNSKRFYDSLSAACDYLDKHFYKGYCGKEKRFVNCIGHSHIDVAWLWDLEQTRLKSQRTFSGMLKLMERYPSFRYFHTTPQLFEYLKEDNPELLRKTKEKVKEGRFELDGSMWVEADCNLTSGESLVRQFLYGINYFKKEFDVDCSCLFLPDVFGYSAQLPQIMSKCDIHRFVTAKIGWNDTNRFPYDSFDWQGIDGSKVFTYLISTCDANPRIGVMDTTYTDYVGKLNASQLLGTWNRYQQKDINDLTFTTFGWGDGGGGPTIEMLEKEKRFENGLPGLGKTRIASLRETLDEIENNCRNATNPLPTWDKELYFEYHRGTYTSVPRIKRNNRYGELALSNVESLSTIDSTLLGEKYPKDSLDKNWKVLLQNQFHDILPGSAIEKVYLDSDIQFASLFKETDSLIDSSLDRLAKNVNAKDGYLVYNPMGLKTSGYIQIDGRCVEVPNVPSFGYKVIECKKNLGETIKIGDRWIENNFFKLELNNKGEIISLYDKRLQKEFVSNGSPLNSLACFEDMPYQYDNWELAPYYYEKEYAVDSVAKFEYLDEGDRKGIKIIRSYLSSTIIQKIYLYSSIERIDVVNEIDWKEKKQVLKCLFPANFKYEDVRYGIQFGNISRKAKPENSFDEAKFEVPSQMWADMSDGEVGLAILNESKFGYGCKDGVLSLTFLKSGSFPYEGASDVVPPFTYSLYPHTGDFRNGRVIEEAYSLNRPLLAKKIDNAEPGKLPKEYSFIETDARGVYLETVKRSEDGSSVIARLYEGHGEEKDINIKANFPYKEAHICNLLEKDDKKINSKEGVINLHIGKFEIMTIKFVC